MSLLGAFPILGAVPIYSKEGYLACSHLGKNKHICSENCPRAWGRVTKYKVKGAKTSSGGMSLNIRT